MAAYLAECAGSDDPRLGAYARGRDRPGAQLEPVGGADTGNNGRTCGPGE